MEMKISFDPSTLKYNDEAYPAFEAGGITLTFWALYKKHFITNQYFKDSLEKMGELFKKMFNGEEITEGGEYLISGFVKGQIEYALEALSKGSLYQQDNNGWER